MKSLITRYEHGIPYVLMALAALMFIPFLGSVHLFDWDEINFAEAAREMILSGNYLQVQIDYKPFWEKPPVFIWMQALSMQVFGMNEFAARLPNALCGILTLPILYGIGRSLRSAMFGFLWALTYAGSFLPHFYFKSGIIDPWFNLFILLGIVFPFLPMMNGKRVLSFSIAGVFLGLAILTKGPVAFLVAFLVYMIYAILQGKDSKTITSVRPWIINFAILSLAALLTSMIWFGIEIIQNGTWFVEEFIRYQIRLFSTGDAGHSGPFYYHAVILLLGCFPASFIVLPAILGKHNELATDTIMTILFWTVLILFSIVKTKIVHYSSLCYFPLTYMAALRLYYYVTTKEVPKRVLHWLVPGVSIWTLLLIIIPLIGVNKEILLPLINDEFTRAMLQSPVQWTGYEVGIGLLYALLSFTAFFFLSKSETVFKGLVLLFFSTIPAIFLFLPLIAPKIEGYTQAMPIAFYTSMQNNDVLVYPMGFKSYAHLFYSAKKPQLQYSNNELSEEDLLNGASIKPVFFVAKLKKAKELQRDKRLKMIYNHYGYAVFRVVPEQQ